MKEFSYKPKKLINEDGSECSQQWSGTVIVKVPSYKERLLLIKSMNLGVGSDGELAKESGVDSAIKMFEVVEKHVVAVDLKYADQSFISVDDLGCSKEGSALINEIALVIIQGISLGNG